MSQSMISHAQRKLDAEFAEKVLGWSRISTRWCDLWNDNKGAVHLEPHRFHESLTAAWTGVEKTVPKHIRIEFEQVGSGGWGCSIGLHVNCYGATAAEALMRACLEFIQ